MDKENPAEINDAVRLPAPEQNCEQSSPQLPNYAERRKRIFGETVVENAVIAAREDERS